MEEDEDSKVAEEEGMGKVKVKPAETAGQVKTTGQSASKTALICGGLFFFLWIVLHLAETGSQGLSVLAWVF